MQNYEFQGFKWLFRAIDVSTSLGHSVPQTAKDAPQTGKTLAGLCAMFGCPGILQSDNGGEFLAQTKKIALDWMPVPVKVLNGRYNGVRCKRYLFIICYAL